MGDNSPADFGIYLLQAKATTWKDHLLCFFVVPNKSEMKVNKEHRQLREAARIYKDVPVGLCIFDTDLRYVHVNDWLATINGQSVEAHLGRTIDEVIPDVSAGVKTELLHVIETGEPVIDGTVEAETLARPGIKSTFQHSYLPVKSDDGTIIGVTCIVQDITLRKRAEGALRETEKRLQMAIHASGVGIWDWNILTNEEYFSPEWCGIIGYSYDDPELSHDYDSWASRIHPDDYDRVMRALKNHLEDGAVYDVEYRHRHKSGEYRWQQSYGQAIFDRDGKPIRMIGCICDITERKAAEMTLRQDKRQLRALAAQVTRAEEKERRRIAAILHDQASQPLALSRIKLGMLQKALSDPSDLAVLKEVRDLLKQTVEVTRFLTHEISPPILQELGLESAIEGLVEHLSHEHGVEITFEDDDQPKSMDDDVRSFLFQTVHELLINVVKHAHATRANVSIMGKGEVVRIRVEDNGEGFDPSVLFAHDSESLTFGLFNIRERLSHFGGEFEVESDPTLGTKITVSAPFRSVEE